MTADPNKPDPSPPSLVASGSPWYVCFTKPRQEAVAVRKLEEQGYEVFLPTFVEWISGPKGWRTRRQAMFPRYGFVRCGRPGQSVAPIRSTPGVTGLVRFGFILATLDERTVAAIRSLVERLERTAQNRSTPFAAGDVVEIRDGPLKGLPGIVSAVAAERVIVLLSLLGREKPVAIPMAHVARSAGS
ncbi:transcription termination/antitermination protein NusG [Accumulibacter sp.]|nr:transcription termination/antitermination NusG family protein [Accumulibacter sp.]MDS4050621.1 transcription termination/antitermination NusG family protein [Accumulibacter sp.]